MFCEECGKPVLEGAEFCSSCGRRVGVESEIAPLLKRAVLFLEEQDWARADDYCERVLDREPENAQAYLIKLMVRVKVDKEEKLASCTESFESWNSFRNTYRYADEALRQRLDSYLETIAARKKWEAEKKAREAEQLRLDTIYKEGLRWQKMSCTEENLSQAIAQFEKIPGYVDADVRLKDCTQALGELREREKVRAQAEYEAENRAKRRKILVMCILGVALISAAILVVRSVSLSREKQAQEIQANLAGKSFQGTYSDLVSDSNGSWGLVREHTQYTVTYRFNGDGTITVSAFKQYDKEPFITKNGVRQWDSEKKYTNTASGGKVEVSFFGDITVTIDGVSYTLTVDAENEPVSIEINGTVYD